jgi:hypothetical protein
MGIEDIFNDYFRWKFGDSSCSFGDTGAGVLVFSKMTEVVMMMLMGAWRLAVIPEIHGGPRRSWRFGR